MRDGKSVMTLLDFANVCYRLRFLEIVGCYRIDNPILENRVYSHRGEISKNVRDSRPKQNLKPHEHG